MNTNTPIGKGISYDHSLINDKHYFAGYFNLAINNIEEILKNVYSKRFDVGSKNIYQIIEHATSNKISEPDYIQRIEFLKQYFPLLNYLDLPADNTVFKNASDKIIARRKYLESNFKLLIKTVNSLRNFYTHFFHKPLVFESNLHEIIDNLFLQTIIDVKRRKMKDDHTRELIRQSLNDELPLLFEQKRAELKEKKKGNTKIKLDELTIKNAVFNDAFGHLIYKPKGSEHEILKSTFVDGNAENSISIAQNKLLFLLGMFLTKRESKDLRSRIKGFKGNVIKDAHDFPNPKNNSLKYMATHWVYSYLNVKVLKQKLTTSFSKETLLVQIVDELTKIPDEIYRNLSFKRQQEFVEDLNEYIKEGNFTDSLENSIVIHPVIRKRYEDKFNYFVLRYLDEFANFPTLRFQVYLGNYVHNRQAKEIAGTNYETERFIKEKINVFGKLTEVSDLKSEYFINKEQQDQLGWEIFPNPSYNSTSGNIPIFINLQKSNVPNARRLFGQIKGIINQQNKNRNRETNKIDKVGIANLIDPEITHDSFKNVYIGPPTALLSLNELPAILFELLVKKTPSQEVEDKLIQKLIDRFNLLKDYQPGTLTLSQVSKKLRESGNNKSIDTAKLKRAIQNEIEISKSKLDFIQIKIDTYREERRKRGSKQKHVLSGRELGSEATWFANDLKRFMPIESRELWKGYMHSQLQNSLAYFSQRPDEAFSLLAHVWDFNNDSYVWNEPIQNVFKGTKRFEFLYEDYLENRLNFFSGLLSQIEGYADNSKMLKRFIDQQHIDTLFHMREFNIDSTQEQINKLLARPLVFPRGIFDEKPTFIKDVKFSDNPELFADWYQYTYKEHPLQDFYSYEKEYEANFNLQVNVDPDFVKNSKNLDEAAQKDLFKMKEDLKIKGIKAQDLYLKLIAENLYETIFGQFVDLSLDALYTDRKTRYKIAENAKLQSVRNEGDKTENIINDSFIWDKSIAYSHDQIIDTNVKIKDVNKLKRFIEEEKVQTLLSYDKDKKWSRQELEDELFIKSNSYETVRREKLLKKIQDFENEVLNLNGFDGINHPQLLEQGGNPNFKHYVVNGLLLKKELISTDDAAYLLALGDEDFGTFSNLHFEKSETVQRAFLLILVRNKFAHNQLPISQYYQKIRVFVPNEPNTSIAEVIYNFVESTIDQFIQ